MTSTMPRSSMLTLGVGSHAYQMPVQALPYLGHGLDPNLFRVSRLAALEHGGRLPIWISYPSRPPKIPGVTLTTSAHSIARGYVTGASSAVFSSALARQFAFDHAHGSYGRDGIFAGGVAVSLSQPVPSAAGNTFRLHTLTINGTNLAGHPDTGDIVLVFNVDNSTVFDSGGGSLFVKNYGYQSWFYGGVTKLSVPAGHYWAIAAFPRSPSRVQ